MTFDREGGAEMKFEVNDKISHPSSSDLQLATFAKLFSDLVFSLADSNVFPEIRGFIQAAAESGMREYDA